MLDVSEAKNRYSTGNVSYECPSFHASFGIPTPPGAYNHTPEFTACAGSAEAFDLALLAAKGMAEVAWQVLKDKSIELEIMDEFEEDRVARELRT